jgi:hypothetical protein
LSTEKGTLPTPAERGLIHHIRTFFKGCRKKGKFLSELINIHKEEVMSSNESNKSLKRIVEVENKVQEPVETGVVYCFPNNIILNDDNGVNLYNKKMLELFIKS